MPPSLVRIDATEPLEKLLDVIERDGGVIVTNFLSPELLKESMNTSEFGMSHHLTCTENHQLNLASPAASFMTQRPLTRNLVQTSFRRDLNESM
jgi:hypothetical protein